MWILGLKGVTLSRRKEFLNKNSKKLNHVVGCNECGPSLHQGDTERKFPTEA